MIHRQKHSHATYLVVGLALGVLLGLNLLGVGPHVPLHATATHGQDNFAIATGFVDSGNEAMFFLDFLTGDLKAVVPSRQNGAFLSFFQYNIANDFGGGQTKNPKYRMVTGVVNFLGTRGNVKIGRSIVYIAEEKTGVVAAYGIPWNEPIHQRNQPQTGTFVLLDLQPFRNVPIRDFE